MFSKLARASLLNMSSDLENARVCPMREFGKHFSAAFGGLGIPFRKWREIGRSVAKIMPTKYNSSCSSYELTVKSYDTRAKSSFASLCNYMGVPPQAKILRILPPKSSNTLRKKWISRFGSPKFFPPAGSLPAGEGKGGREFADMTLFWVENGQIREFADIASLPNNDCSVCAACKGHHYSIKYV